MAAGITCGKCGLQRFAKDDVIWDERTREDFISLAKEDGWYEKHEDHWVNTFFCPDCKKDKMGLTKVTRTVTYEIGKDQVGYDDEKEALTAAKKRDLMSIVQEAEEKCEDDHWVGDVDEWIADFIIANAPIIIEILNKKVKGEES